jgi:hypothetical protein
MGEGPFEKSLYEQFWEGMLEHIGAKRLVGDEKFSAQLYLKGLVSIYLSIIEQNNVIDPKTVSHQMVKALPQNLVKFYDYKHFEVRSKRHHSW